MKHKHVTDQLNPDNSINPNKFLKKSAVVIDVNDELIDSALHVSGHPKRIIEKPETPGANTQAKIRERKMYKKACYDLQVAATELYMRK